MELVVKRIQHHCLQLVADCQIPFLCSSKRPLNSTLFGGELLPLFNHLIMPSTQASIDNGIPRQQARLHLLGTGSVWFGDGAVNISTTLAESHFLRDVFPQAFLLLQAHPSICADCSHKYFAAAISFVELIPASSRAAARSQ